MQQREAIFEAWVPPVGVWSLWARPVLFAQMPEATGEPPPPAVAPDVSWAPGPGERAVLVVDLPGEESVRAGLALAARGYRPVPLYNGCTGPHEVIDQGPILEALRAGAPYLAAHPLPPDAPPAFLLDARRMSPARKPRPGDFDNCWQVFPQDFPSAAFLLGRGFTRALLVQRGRLEPQEDLAHVLLRWQEAGMAVEARDVAGVAPAAPITVARPKWYRAAWERLEVALGLRPAFRGGFGGTVPQPSHG